MKISFITKHPIRKGEEVAGREIREAIFEFICNEYPGFDTNQYVSLSELNRLRRRYLTHLIEQEKGELAVIDKDVLNAINDNSILSENISGELECGLTFGQRVADRVASFGGSWFFIMNFFTFILFWIVLNIYVLSSQPFDPYPFILLNLILSCIAAIQAPVIMMSQNRQDQKDRQRAEHDYKINLKAELEIKLLGEKIDHLLVHQNKKLLEIQEVQTDYLDDLMKQLQRRSSE